MLEAMLLKLHAKLATGCALIRVNFDPIQEIGPKVGGGRSFVSGPLFVRLWYVSCIQRINQIPDVLCAQNSTHWDC